MTIDPGSSWGVPHRGVRAVVHPQNEAEMAQLAHSAVKTGGSVVARAAGHDTLKTLGLVEPRTSDNQLKYEFDLGYVELDGGELPFAAHVVWRKRLWRGQFAAIMNVAWWKELYLGPRAHPNDGLLDITTGSLQPNQRLLARKRARTASHLPHPGLKVRRVPELALDLGEATPMWVDGLRIAEPRFAKFRVVPDAFSVVG